MPAIETHELSKTYVQAKKQPGVLGTLRGLIAPERTYVKAVKEISLKIEPGEIVGFLGPNGAGKTTTIKMLTGILYPTGGSASVLGYRPFDRKPEMLRRISLVMGNKQQLWWDLPAWDSFVVLRELYDVDHAQFKERIDFLLDALQITDKINTQVRKLSLGERMKCELAAALLHRPELLFLDEPTIGLDVVSQKRIRDFLRQLNAEDGCTILLTSHYMQDVQELCERVVVIDHGEMRFDGTLATLSERYTGSKRLRLSFEGEAPVSGLESFGSVVESGEDWAVLAIPRERVAAVTGSILQAFPISDISVQEVPVDEVIRELFSRESATA